MKNKGFTLIELLAVIVILAIIMVIAVPKILDVIENSRQSAAQSSIKLVKDAIKTQVITENMMGQSFDISEDKCYFFDFDNQENGNSSKLSLKNKDRIGGSIKYCNGEFKEDTLTFDGIVINNKTEKIKLCKRATTLHTDMCEQNDTTYYCSGAGYENGSTITYGNTQSTKGILKSGDAFDCDVDGSGTYDSDERFYYVTDLDTNSNYAVLIYYNNVSSGEPNNIVSKVYSSSMIEYIGPNEAIVQLPTISKWNNVKLTNTIRNIKDENDVIKVNNFSYAGYSSRLLTVQELMSGCSITIENNEIGELDVCNYLMENTKYSSNDMGTFGYWLESPWSTIAGSAWSVSGYDRLSLPTDNNGWGNEGFIGVRPVI